MFWPDDAPCRLPSPAVGEPGRAAADLLARLTSAPPAEIDAALVELEDDDRVRAGGAVHVQVQRGWQFARWRPDLRGRQVTFFGGIERER